MMKNMFAIDQVDGYEDQVESKSSKTN